MKKVVEKRKRVRFKIPSLVKYKQIPNSTTYRISNLKDISVIGIAFVADRAIPENAELEISFLDPDGKEMTLEGKVIHCEQVGTKPQAHRIGVEYRKISTSTIEALSQAEKYFLTYKKK